MSNMNKPQEIKIPVSKSQLYKQFWDFKVHFKNSSIVYYYTLTEEINFDDLLNFLIKRFRVYIAYDIYEMEHSIKEYDMQIIDKIIKNLDWRRARAIILKYLEVNPLSKLVTQ